MQPLIESLTAEEKGRNRHSPCTVMYYNAKNPITYPRIVNAVYLFLINMWKKTSFHQAFSFSEISYSCFLIYWKLLSEGFCIRRMRFFGSCPPLEVILKLQISTPSIEPEVIYPTFVFSDNLGLFTWNKSCFDRFYFVSKYQYGYCDESSWSAKYVFEIEKRVLTILIFWWFV